MDTKQDENAAEELTFSTLDAKRVPAEARHRQRAIWLRTRLGRLALSALCALLVMGTVVVLVSGIANTPLQTVYDDFTGVAPPSTLPILPGQDTFVVYNDAPWGKLTVDGRVIKFTTPTPAGPGFTLTRGVHHLIYLASHFPALRCVVSVPRGTQDTCPLIGHQNDGAGGVVDQERYLDLGAKPERLSHADYQTLLAAVNTSLEGEITSATIEPGERYVNAAGQTVVATLPLTFSLGLMLESTTLTAGNVGYSYAPTDQYGAVPRLVALPIQASVTLSRAIGADTPILETMAPSIIPVSEMMDLTVTENARGAWDIHDPLPGAAFSFFAQTYMSLMASELLGPALQFGWSFSGDGNPAEGLAMSGAANGAQTQLVLFWRFDVLYTANDAAAKQFPKLPRANSAEQRLAMSILNG
jgi:hypothetical protein